jgi:hypothetical protein
MTVKIYGIFGKALAADSVTKRGAYIDLIEENRTRKSPYASGFARETLLDLLDAKPASNRRAVDRLLTVLESEFIEKLKSEKGEKVSEDVSKVLSDILEVLVKAESVLEQRTFNSPGKRKQRKKLSPSKAPPSMT